MKAIITTNYGGPEVLTLEDVPAPEVGPNDLLVEVRASPVTAGDRRLRAADFPSFTALPGRMMVGAFRPRRPVQGSMFAGRVVAVGDAVEHYAVGDDVFGSVSDGAWAERLTVPADGPVAKIPPGVSYAEAAEVPYGAVTALRFLRDLADVQPGEHVAIVGAAGGVGRFAVQVAAILGARVTAVSDAGDASLVRELGARDVVDYRTENFLEGSSEYDVIFDLADVTSFSRCRHALTSRGRYLTPMATPESLWNTFSTQWSSGQRAHFGVAFGTAGDMAQIATWLEEGRLRAVVARELPLEEMAEAHRLAAQRPAGGVVVRLVG